MLTVVWTWSFKFEEKIQVYFSLFENIWIDMTIWMDQVVNRLYPLQADSPFYTWSAKMKLEYYPYDKYKSPHTETPTSNLAGGGGRDFWKSEIWT